MRAKLRKKFAVFGWFTAAAIASFASCARPYECIGPDCTCFAGASCDLPCDAPPCSLTCEADNPSCTGACGNGECRCGPGADCAFDCQSPPCHTDCAADSSCSGTCANGECTCALGADCAFDCGAPPCHVTCAGKNPRCNGTCSNGTCACGPDSDCRFGCESGPCHATCPEGARCVVACPDGKAGTQDCDIIECAAGAPTICPGGRATTCNAPCPVTEG